MSQSVTVRASGLKLTPSEATAGSGACVAADNVVVSRDNRWDPRRGFSTMFAGALKRLFPYRGVFVAVRASDALARLTGASNLYSLTDYGVTAAGPFSGVPVRAAEASSTLFVSTAEGVKAIETPSASTVLDAGVPYALDVQLALSGSGTSMPADGQRAYRVLWGRKDANERLLLGAPSAAMTITNPAGGSASNVTITTPVPSGIVAGQGWFLQVYRSQDSVAATVSPDDECLLVYEAPYVSGTTMTVTDVVPAGGGTTSLYTNQSQQGTVAAAYPPPKCADLVAFRGSMFWLRCQEKATLSIWMMTIPALAETILITGTTGFTSYAAGAAEDVATRTFRQYTLADFGGSQFKAIAATAASLIRVINRDASAAVYAEDISVPGGTPGHIRLTARSYATSSLSVTYATPATWGSGAATVTKTATEKKHALRWSPTQIPDSAPIVNEALIGSAEKPGYRIVPTRESLFIFKEDGVWRLTGDAGVWSITPFDPTIKLIAPESAVALDNAVWALTEQGVVRLTESGTEVVSRDIEPALQYLLTPSPYGSTTTGNRGTTAATAFAVAYDDDRKYLLCLPTAPSDTEATQVYVFDYFANAWTRWVVGGATGCVNPGDDVLYLAGSAGVKRENKRLANADHNDDGLPVETYLQWAAQMGEGGPGTLKHWQEIGVSLVGSYLGANDAITLGFATEHTAPPEEATVTVSGADQGWNSGPYAQNVNVRTLVPLEQQRSARLNVSLAASLLNKRFGVESLTVKFTQGGTKVRR